MIKDILKQQQPVVYQTLKNALDNDKIAHAYMFSGPSGTMKKEAAYLLAQSLICETEGFACETCNTCKRIAANEYVDVKYIDGSKTSIKKDDIIKLQREFSKTGLESSGKKVYILNYAENATPDALNSLLKFLEEPTSDMVAILIVEQMDRVLPTIISRCQNIPFTALSFDTCYDSVKDEIDLFDAFMLSHMKHQKQNIIDVSETDDYQHAKYVFKTMIDYYKNSVNRALLFLQLEGFNVKEKKYGKQCLQYVIDMLLIFFKDQIKHKTMCEDEWYLKTMKAIQEKDIDRVQMIQILMYSKDMLLKSVNIHMLIDQMLYKMKEVTR